MDFTSWYSSNCEPELSGRFITLKHISPLLEVYKNFFQISVAGFSEMKNPIPIIKIGQGPIKVLAWSQMHGNESTTTKALFDFLKFLNQNELFQMEIKQFLKSYTLYLVPMLNPDGAEKYTRENANGVDLNRDAELLTQAESQVLRTQFEAIKPDLCLNLHDQRSIYGLEKGLPATISFLAPAIDENRSITKSRKTAMEHIVRMNNNLQNHIPGQVGRYDDNFNINCVGDTFQNAGVPTILFEAGHFGGDYQRNNTRELIFYSLLELFYISKSNSSVDYNDYFKIPENRVNYKDFILRNVKLEDVDNPVSVAIQYDEIVKDGRILFVGKLETIGDLSNFYGHTDVNGFGEYILINSQKTNNIGDVVSIIVNKNEKNTIYFQ